ncbi:RNA polymerase sigma factor [Sphingobacterium sp. BIGb0165]|uniref:RNA polymerase sigma factor n=1 Tax=Sphingobacterium sp. BIGb0165 TaxID=2940615 RepID=UPI0021695A0D|nr:sigma-70 family RNA polymerase sigma factor [Sphingobacterium sp. BIGb0165]MCS4227049.1 RNA polymerase sigma-70 factor (ECF subfamily) [Sphingobacterium sp. BIGb0165]
MRDLSDKELFDIVREGNTQAFSVLFDRYADILLSFVLKRIGSITDAEDILQEVFTSLWNRRYKIEIEESIYPYLFKAAKYEVIDWMARDQKRISYFERLVFPLTNEPVGASNSDEKLMVKELSFLLDNEVAKMPSTMQSAFNLSRIEGLSIKEIAFRLSISEQTVKNNISLALSRLKLKAK